MRLGVGVEQQLVRIEAMAVARVVWAVHAVGIDRARPCLGQIAVPYLVGVLGKFDAFEFGAPRVVEQAELDLGGVGGEQREIDTKPVPCRTAWVGRTLGDTRLPKGSGHKVSPPA